MNKQLKSVAPKNHHSTADWDFYDPTRWELSATHYVSSPTALHAIQVMAGVSCRLAETLVLPEGRLVTYTYHSGVEELFLAFRKQQLLGDATQSDDYHVDLDPRHNVRLRTRVSAVEDTIDSWPIQTTLDTWHRWRLTFWNGQDPWAYDALCVELEHEEAEAWVSYGVLYHRDNLWADSDKNRIGFGRFHPVCWMDDTEIWIPS